MSSLIGFRSGRGFPPPRALITATSPAIRHCGDSKKSAGPSRTRPFPPFPSRSNRIFIKTQRPRDRPARTRRAAASVAPFVSFPLFTRRRGRHPGGGRRPRERKILTIGKSRIVSQSSVENGS